MKKIIPFACALALAATPAVMGQNEAVSNPVGYVTENLLPGFNLIGLNLHNAVEASGAFESESGATLTDNEGNFSSLDLVNQDYILEITSGSAAGATAFIDSATATTITVSGGGSLGAGAASYNIREAVTLDDVFGTTTLTGSFNDIAADVVWVPDGSGGYTQYFFNNVGNQFRPTDAPFANADPVPLLYADGLLVQNKGAAKPLVIAGSVKVTPTAVSSLQGFNAVSVPGPVGVTLAESELQNFLTGSFNDVAADVVWVPNGSGGYTQYFYNNVANVWRLTSSPFAGDEGSVELPSAVFIQRKGADTSGVFDLPPAYDSL